MAASEAELQLLDPNSAADATLVDEKPGSGKSWLAWLCFEDPSIDGPIRDVYWDNFKGLTQLGVIFIHMHHVTLCVAGFFIAGFMDSVPGRLWFGLFTLTCVYVMPAFAFVSGYFSTATPGPKQLDGQVRLVVAFMIQHLLQIVLPFLTGFPHASGKFEWPLQLFHSSFECWYLFALFLWRLILPVFARLSWPFTASLVIALASFWTDVSGTFGNAEADCVFSLFPFFVAGFLAKAHKEKLESWRGYPPMIGLFVVAVVATVSSTLLTWPDDPVGFARECAYNNGKSHPGPEKYYRGRIFPLTFGDGQNEEHCRSSLGMKWIFVWYLLAFVSVVSSLAVFPSKNIPVVSRCGRNVLYVYLLHPWIRSIIVYNGIPDSLFQHKFFLGPWGTVFAGLATVTAIWALLGQTCVKRITKPAIEPDIEKWGLIVKK